MPNPRLKSCGNRLFQEESKATIYWPAIKGMRNLLAHNYGAVDIDRVWETAIVDVPILFSFCEEVLLHRRMIEQSDMEDEWEP